MNKLPVSPQLLGLLGAFLLLFFVLAVLGKVPLQYNLRNLVVRWPVTLLTALVFTIVAGLLTAMMAFVNGMYKLTEGSAQPGNVIVLSDGANDELFSNLGFRDTSDLERDPPNILRDAKGQPLASWELYLVVNQPMPEGSPVPARTGRRRRFIQLRGLDDPQRSGQVHGLDLHPGGAWFSDAGVQAIEEGGQSVQAVQAVLGEGIARELGADVSKPSLEPGDVFDLGPRRWVVTGVLKSGGTTFDSEVWVKRQVAGPMFGKESSYTALVLRTENGDTARETADWVTANYKKSAVQAQTETDYYEKLNGTNQQFLVVFIVVMIFLAIGGVFGVMIAMFASISQRIKDIGVLRIVGFARWQVLMSFFLETLLIALLGGVIGVLLGSLTNGVSMSSIAGSGAGGGGKSVVFKMTVDNNIRIGAIVFILVMGCLGGLLPALNAMRLRALESLR
jgi:hypothetical protein